MLESRTLSVAIIDSGAGGLTVAKEIAHRKLNINLQYIADKAYFPYGLLHDQALIDRLLYLVEKTEKQCKPDIYILACNTASTLALEPLRERWSTPFIGVVPAVKPAASNSIKNKIAVLATNATIGRQYLEALIDEHAKNTTVECYGAQKLVQLAEHYLVHQKLNKSELTHELTTLLEQGSDVDQVVLACTHFPILKEEISAILAPRGINVVDSTAAIVNRLCQILPETMSLERSSYEADFFSSNDAPLESYSRYVFGEIQNLSRFHYHF